MSSTLQTIVDENVEGLYIRFYSETSRSYADKIRHKTILKENNNLHFLKIGRSDFKNDSIKTINGIGFKKLDIQWKYGVEIGGKWEI